MLALEVRVNGELKAVCGAEAMEHLVGCLWAVRRGGANSREFSLKLKCEGNVVVNSDVKEGLKWIAAPLKLGDEVSLKFVNADHVNEPIDRQQYPSRTEPPDA